MAAIGRGGGDRGIKSARHFVKLPRILVDILTKLFPAMRVFLPGADIHVSVCFRAILGGPTGAVIITGDFCDFVAKDHDVVAV